MPRRAGLILGVVLVALAVLCAFGFRYFGQGRAASVSLAGINPQTFLEAVQRLQNTQERLAALQKNNADSEAVRTALYPIDFLNALGNLEEARIAYMASSTYTTEQAYQQAQELVNGTYTEDIKRFRDAFQRVVPADIGVYATPSTLVKRADVLTALDVLEHSRPTSGSALSVPSVSPASSTRVALAQKIFTLYQTSGTTFEDSQLYQLSDSVCIPASLRAAPLFAFRTAPGYLTPFYVGDIILQQSSAAADLPLFSYFAQRSIPYVQVIPLNYYECPRADEDEGTLLAMRATARFAKTAKLSAYASEQTTALKLLEEQRPVITEQDVALYLNAAHKVSRLPKDLAENVVSLSQQMQERSWGVYQTMLDITYDETMSMHLKAKTGVDVSALYLFFTRSGFAPLLLNANSSATGMHQSLFQKNDLPTREQPYVFYSSLLQTPATDHEMLKDLRFYAQLHTL